MNSNIIMQYVLGTNDPDPHHSTKANRNVEGWFIQCADPDSLNSHPDPDPDPDQGYYKKM